MDEETWGLVFDFPDQSSSFVYGFEAGQLFARMHGLEDAFVFLTHPENREVIRRIADYLGWAVEFLPIENEGRDNTTLTKKDNYRERINPHGLRVVE